MASSRDNEHFALDWIKSDLLETLNQARVALDEYAEQGEDETRLRACLTNLHQLHGTLLMLELEGITLLADHLEQAAQKLMLGDVEDAAGCSQVLMQGILEMPGYLDELQRGSEDKVGVFIPLVNEIRAQLQLDPMVDTAGQSLNTGASEESVERFVQLDGQTKVTRMRSAYQNVLLSILKGDDRAAAIDTLKKIAVGLQRLTTGSSMERQWQAFGEFVNSLADKEGALESDAVKLLRRVDIEIKNLAADGEGALKRPANLELVQSLLDATDAQEYESETVSGLREAVERDSSHNTLAISGRQALATAAVALSDELAVIKDKLDLLARATSLDLEALRELTTPLGQIGSTLSLLGFESSREIIADQSKAIEEIVVLGDVDPAGIQSIAGALAQVDENLNSVSSERSEIEQITGEAQLQLLREASSGLETVKLAVVDYVTAHWDIRHLENTPQVLRETCGALDIIPLPRVTSLLNLTNTYIETKLLQGHQPDWQELDRFADVISGIDYFLERLAEENTQGMEDILQVAERSLTELLPVDQDIEVDVPVEEQAQAQELGTELEAELDQEQDQEQEIEPTAILDDVSDVLVEQSDDAEASSELELVEMGDAVEINQPTETSEFELQDLELAADADSIDSKEPGPADISFEAVSAEEFSAELIDADEPATTTEGDSETLADIEYDFEFGADDDESAAADAEIVAESDSDSDTDAGIDAGIETDLESAAEVTEPLSEIESVFDPEELTFGVETKAVEDAGMAEDAGPAEEDEDAFDLSSDVFANLEGVIEQAADSDVEEPHAETLETENLEAESIETESIETEAVEAETIEAETIETEGIEASEVAESAEEEIVFEGEPPDEEIIEIFLEEVTEVLETIDEYLPQWANELSDGGEALTEVRRAFHTLKGSGRIVQAVEIGELAWGIENMLNRVIDGTVQPTPQFNDLISRARDLVPSLADAFERRRRGNREAIAEVIEAADMLASGGSLEQESTPVVVEEEFANLEFVSADDVSADEPVESLETSFADETLEVSAEELAAAEEEAEAQQLFKDEITEGIAVLRTEQLARPWSLSEPIRRTLHTMAGTAATAKAEQISFIVGPANQVVEVFSDIDPIDGLQEFFDELVQQLEKAIAELNAPDWEDPVELVAQADDLIALGLTKPNLLGELLNSEAIETLFSSEDALPEILSGAVPGTVLLSALTDCVGLAAKAEQTATADLAAALMRTVTAATISGGVPNNARETIQQGHSALLDQLNGLVAGSEVADRADVIELLDHVDFTAEAEETSVEDASVEETSLEEAPIEEASIEDAWADEAQTEEVAADADAEIETPNLADLDIDADLIEVFFEEAEEISEELETTILDWSGERENRLYLENILRGLHTLKGGARLCGLMHIGDMAHDFESMVIRVQNEEREVDDELFKDLHSRFDGVVEQLALVKRELFNTAETDATETADAVAEEQHADEQQEAKLEESIDQETDQLEEVVASEMAEADSAEDAVEPDSALEAVANAEEELAETAEKQTEAIKIPQVAAVPTPQPAQVAAQADETDSAQPEASPEKIERSPQEMVRVGAGLLEELVNLAGENSILRARIEQGMSDFTGALDEMETTIDRLREQLRRLEIETETQVLFRNEREDGPEYENFDPLEMDRYSQLQQLSRGLSESASDMLDLKDTLLFKARESETLLLQQARINTELQEGLMRTRMVPFNRLMPRLRRIVRQVAGELEKEVEFHVQNAEGELDRNLLERMVPPLEHMLRNAVDHGVEMPSERRNYGKSATGRIDLKLSREGGDVVIEISDDGAGIDVESVRAKALEKGMCEANSILSDDDVMQFVLAPGFSTAKSVTQISGRGVGMDVVHSEVKQLGGSISISSNVGKGTRFVVRVPFTVSVNRALMVSVAEDQYAIPLNNIEGIVLLNPEELEDLHSSENATFEYAGVPYRPRYLGQYLGREYRGPQVGQTSVPVVLVRSGDHAVAIHVDSVQGSREIVVKSLGPQFAGVGGISGATILGDGSVVVILDLLALIRAQRQFGKQQTTDVVGLGRPRCVMVVDDSVTVRKVTSRLLERQGMDVLVAKDGVEAVALLQERRPDVMLLDIEMPRMDGFEVARQVRHDERLDNLPIVMISSRTGEKHKEHANQLGVNKFLGKPFQENELLATIDELVTRM